MKAVKPIPKVAVITRTKNRPHFLRRAVASVLGQTFQDWIHVVVNDGGDPVEVESLLQTFEASYQGRLLLIHNKDSIGMQNASNKGIEQSQSEFLSIHDDDDSWDPSFLTECVSFLEREGRDSIYQGVISKTIQVIESIDDQNVIQIIEEKPYIPVEEVNLLRIGYENPFPPIAFLYRRRVHESIGLFDPSLDYAGDMDFNYRFLKQYEIGVVAEALANYHIRKDLKSGINSNTVVADSNRHRQLLNEFLNKLARNHGSLEDLIQGLAVNITRYLSESQWRIALTQEETIDTASRLRAFVASWDSFTSANSQAHANFHESLKSGHEKLDDLRELAASLKETQRQMEDFMHIQKERNEAFWIQSRISKIEQQNVYDFMNQAQISQVYPAKPIEDHVLYDILLDQQKQLKGAPFISEGGSDISELLQGLQLLISENKELILGKLPKPQRLFRKQGRINRKHIEAIEICKHILDLIYEGAGTSKDDLLTVDSIMEYNNLYVSEIALAKHYNHPKSAIKNGFFKRIARNQFEVNRRISNALHLLVKQFFEMQAFEDTSAFVDVSPWSDLFWHVREILHLNLPLSQRNRFCARLRRNQGEVNRLSITTLDLLSGAMSEFILKRKN